jgi:Predicted transcriptional regulators
MSIEDCSPTGVDIKDTGFGYTLSVIGGKYKMIIMYWLAERKVIRFNEFKRFIATISYKSLSSALKDLEADGIVVRTEFPQIPPKVEYRLSERGESLLPVLHVMCEWGKRNRI